MTSLLESKGKAGKSGLFTTGPVHSKSRRKTELFFKWGVAIENASFALYCGRKSFCKRWFSKRRRLDNHVIINSNPQGYTPGFLPPVILEFSNFRLRLSVDGKYFDAFSE